MYSSPTSRGSLEFPPAYHSHHHAAAPPGGMPPQQPPQSPLKSRAARGPCPQFQATGACPNGDNCPYSHSTQRYDSPASFNNRTSPTPYQSDQPQPQGSPSSLGGQRTMRYQAPVHHQPPPPYGAPPPPPYDGMGHGSPMMPPPPSYQEHMHASSRHETPLNGRDQSPRREHHIGTPTSGEPPSYPTRFRHDPYSPEGSRVVSPNRRDM